MKTYTARPSAAELRKLRHLVRMIQSRPGLDLRTPELVALGRRMSRAYAVTIDFDAIADLGYPLVMMRLALNRRLARGVFQTLSPRERQVASLVAFGFRNREVAEQLGISLATVKDHVHHILQKAGLTSRAALIAASAGAGSARYTDPSKDGLN